MGGRDRSCKGPGAGRQGAPRTWIHCEPGERVLKMMSAGDDGGAHLSTVVCLSGLGLQDPLRASDTLLQGNPGPVGSEVVLSGIQKLPIWFKFSHTAILIFPFLSSVLFKLHVTTFEGRWNECGLNYHLNKEKEQKQKMCR